MYIVGLGNPGKEYANSRHNVGFMVLDKLKGQNPKLKTIKPGNYMNRSGEALKHLKASQLIVIHDDVDLPLGTIRIRKGGSSAGHKGIKSVIDALGPSFWRLRVGVGRPLRGIETDDYVLSEFTAKERPALKKVIAKAADCLLQIYPKGEIIAQTIVVN